MTELNLTDAARRVGKTQSAVSHSLKRLRTLTGDELFERTGRGVRPTPRALEMEREVRRALQMLQGTLRSRTGFDPATEKRTFLLDTPAGLDRFVAPQLAERLKDAPGITIRLSGFRAGLVLDEPRYRDTWLALDYVQMHQEGFRCEVLYEDEVVLIARAGHPRLADGPRIEDLRRLGQVGIGWAQPGNTQPVYHPLDDRLQAANLPRIVRLWVPTFASMFASVESSDLVAYTSARTARIFSAHHQIKVHKVPARVRPVQLVMVWHEGFEGDAGHRWLRETVRDICARL